MIVCGSAGTGKSYLINCIKEMLGSECILAAPTGVAAFNIGGQTLHSLLRILLQKTSFSDVQGPHGCLAAATASALTITQTPG